MVSHVDFFLGDICMRRNIAIALLSSTFLCSNATARDIIVNDWQNLNDVIRSGNTAIVSQDLTQWEWGNINILNNNPRKNWFNFSGYNPNGNYTLTGNSTNNARFLQWYDGDMYGGYITLSVENINLQDFKNTNVDDGTVVAGGAINVKSNSENNYFNINRVNFKNNIAESSDATIKAEGGAIRNYVIYGQDTSISNSIFEGNIAKNTVDNTNSFGGAMAIGFSQYVENYITQNTYNINNSVFSQNTAAYGGAVSINTESATEGNTPVIEFKNVIFRDNIADIHGGAINSNTDFKLTADGNGTKTILEGNKLSSGEQEAIYMSNAASTLTINSTNGGTIEIKDIINGEEGYNVNITGDTKSSVLLYNDINNANVSINNTNVGINGNVDGINNLEISSSSILGLGINGELNVDNMKQINNSTSSSTLQIDVKVTDNQINNGIINVNGDISGSYGIIINSLNRQHTPETSAFLRALNDDLSTATNLSILRVKGSPYMWNTILNDNGETQGSTWYLAMDTNPANIILAPEVLAGIGLHEASIAQTNSVINNVSNKLASTRSLCHYCGIVSNAWDGSKLDNGWISIQGENVNINKPVDMEGNIWGLEAGFDIQRNRNNTFGIFTSYRNGEYDLTGKSSGYVPTTGSKINIDSYLAGLYYRYDKNKNWLFATLYGGKQDAKINTDDNIASFKTDGVEYGAGVELGHSTVLDKNTTLSPIISVQYHQINYDETHDNVDKCYRWNDLKQVGITVSTLFEKRYTDGKIQIKPSIIQTITGDDKVSISEIGEVETYKDKTLGQIELSGIYDFNQTLSGYGWLSYTYGSSYNATNLGVGINYNW